MYINGKQTTHDLNKTFSLKHNTSLCGSAVFNGVRAKLQVSTVHLFFAAQAPDATTASLALEDNKAET